MAILSAVPIFLLLTASPVSPLETATSQSDYRVLYMVAPEDKEEPYRISDFPYVILADAKSIRTIDNNYRALRIIHLRHRLSEDDTRIVIAHHDVNISCVRHEADIAQLTYENVHGIVDGFKSWKPSIPGAVVDYIFDIVCSTSKPGSPLGALARDQLVGLLSTRPLQGRFTNPPRIHFPQRAADRNVLVGIASVQCQVDRSEQLKNCSVLADSNPEFGFGNVAMGALSMSKYKTNNFGTITFKVEFRLNGPNSVIEIEEP